jgi:hypothetical protein
MKKFAYLLSAVIVLTGLIGLQSCQTAKTATAAKMLKFNFENGKGYDYEMTTSMDQEIMGQSMKMDMSAYYSMEVAADDGNTKTITTSIDRFKMKVDVVGMNLEVDTDKPMTGAGITGDDKNPLEVVNRLFGSIKGKQFTMKVDAEGKVQEVSGFENMGRSIVDSMDLDEKDRGEMIKKFDEQFNAKNMKGQFERFLYIFPNKAVKVGDSWEKDSEAPGAPMAGKYHSVYKVTDIEGDMVTLEEKTKILSAEQGMVMSGNVTGTLVVDSKTGLVVTADQDMKMTTSAKGMSFEMIGKTKIKGKAR